MMEVIQLTNDAIFNAYGSIGIYWGFALASGFAVLSLFRA